MSPRMMLRPIAMRGDYRLFGRVEVVQLWMLQLGRWRQ
jgi:hypothetical protein